MKENRNDVEPAKITFAHPGTPPFAQNAARALLEVGLLASYVTTFAYKPNASIYKALRGGGSAMRKLEKEMVRRLVTEIPDDLVELHPTFELLRVFAKKMHFGLITEDIIHDFLERSFSTTVAHKHLDDVCAIYSYENASREAFREAKKRGKLCYYDLPIAHHKTTNLLLKAEWDNFPEAETTYTRRSREREAYQGAIKDEEISLADLIVVPSSFVKRSLIDNGVPESRIVVVPFGAPPVKARNAKPKNRPFVFLSAGSQDIRKGTHYLLEAWRKLQPTQNVELWMIGHMTLPPALLDNLPGTVIVRPSVPHRELFEMYQRAGALVFPSLCEGFGMVITEAMSYGTPVITTTNTAGEDIIRDGENGFIVPIRDSDALAASMQWCLDNDDELNDIGRQAAVTVAKWQWADYRQVLGYNVKQHFDLYTSAERSE